MAMDPMPECEFGSLLARARAGSQTALSHLVTDFTPTIYRAIRRAMAKSVRQTADSDDIAQSVWRSFFAQDTNLDISSPARLHGFLKRMATFKTIDCGRRFFVKQRRIQSAPTDLCAIQDENALSPSKKLIAQECLQKLIDAVPPKFSEVIRKRAEGATISEISAELDIPLRSLHRILQNARSRTDQ